MKKWILPLILLLVLAGLVVGTVLLKKGNEEPPAESEAEETYIFLAEYDPSSIVMISYVYEGGDEVKLVYKDGKWRAEGDDNLPLDQDTLDALATALATVAVDREVVKSTETPEEFDLKEPQTRVMVTCKDGTSMTYSLGKEEPFTGDFYLMASSSEAVYLVNAAMKDFLKNSLEDMLVLDTLPAIETDAVTKLELVNAAGETTFSLLKTGDREYTLNGGETEIGTDYIELVTDLSVDHLVFYDALTDEVLAGYGLDEANRSTLTLTYEEEVEISAGEASAAGTKTLEHTLRIFLGKSEEADGLTYIFYRIDGSDYVYKTPTDAFGEILL